MVVLCIPIGKAWYMHVLTLYSICTQGEGFWFQDRHVVLVLSEYSDSQAVKSSSVVASSIVNSIIDGVAFIHL